MKISSMTTNSVTLEIQEDAYLDNKYAIDTIVDLVNSKLPDGRGCNSRTYGGKKYIELYFSIPEKTETLFSRLDPADKEFQFVMPEWAKGWFVKGEKKAGLTLDQHLKLSEFMYHLTVLTQDFQNGYTTSVDMNNSITRYGNDLTSETGKIFILKLRKG